MRRACSSTSVSAFSPRRTTAATTAVDANPVGAVDHVSRVPAATIPSVPGVCASRVIVAAPAPSVLISTRGSPVTASTGTNRSPEAALSVAPLTGVEALSGPLTGSVTRPADAASRAVPSSLAEVSRSVPNWPRMSTRAAACPARYSIGSSDIDHASAWL